MHGIRHGVGRVRYQNDDVYEGSWHQGLICGFGSFTCAVDKTVFHGNFGLRLSAPPPLVNIETHGPRLRTENGTAPDWPQSETPPLGLTPVEGLHQSAHPPPHPLYRRHGFLLCGEGSIRWRDGRVFRGGFFGGVPVTEPGLPVPLSEQKVELPLLWRLLKVDEEYSKTEIACRLNLERERKQAGRPTCNTYTGEMTFDCVPHGVGRCLYSSGASYEGQWEMGLRHGDGVDFGWPGQAEESSPTEPASKWVGPMVHGERTGFGQLTLQDGRTYVGECVCGRMEGAGRLMREDRVSYHVGTFRGGVPHGRGCVESPGGVRFECTWVEGRREGRGVTVSPSGEQCEAVYEKDSMVGGGLFLFRLPAPPHEPAPGHGASGGGLGAACRSAREVGATGAVGDSTDMPGVTNDAGTTAAEAAGAEAGGNAAEPGSSASEAGDGAANSGSDVSDGRGKETGGEGAVGDGDGAVGAVGGGEGSGAAGVAHVAPNGHAAPNYHAAPDGRGGQGAPAVSDEVGIALEGPADRFVSRALALPQAEAIVAQARELARRWAEAKEQRPLVTHGQKGVGGGSHGPNPAGVVSHGQTGPEKHSTGGRGPPHATPSGSGVAAALALSSTRAAAHTAKPAHSSAAHRGSRGGGRTGGDDAPGFGQIGAGRVLASLGAGERPVRLVLAVRWRPVGAQLAVKGDARVALRLCCEAGWCGAGGGAAGRSAGGCEAVRCEADGGVRHRVVCCATLTVPPVYEWSMQAPVAAPATVAATPLDFQLSAGWPWGEASRHAERACAARPPVHDSVMTPSVSVA